MSPSAKLDKDEKGKPVDVKLYRSMIGSLLYLTASRPDIMFSVCLCAFVHDFNLIVQIYVDDIIFGSTNENLCKDFSKIMQNEFKISMIGELKFFLGLQIKQTKGGIFLNQSKYAKDY